MLNPAAATTLKESLAQIVGTSNLLTAASDMAGYCRDWRGRYHGKALAVVRPGNTDEVAAVVRTCAQAQVAIVPQGGNTSLCGGATPDGSGQQIILSLQRLRNIRGLDPQNLTLLAEAGCTLQAVQHAAAEAGLLFPLSLAAEGTCTIGGNLSTNAGGTAVLRYGNARSLCLGLEVVTPQGEIWSSLKGLRKDNTGYDLRNLFIGAEGTLGIITAAVLQLFPQPRAYGTALVGVPDLEAAVTLLHHTQRQCASTLTTFEFFSAHCLQLVRQQFPNCRSPLPETPAIQGYVLLEVSSPESAAHAQQLLEHTLLPALENGWGLDSAVATSEIQRQQFWALRENISEAQAKIGKNIKHDIALPISQLAPFVDRCNAALQADYPEIGLVIFGHLGDGNLHYNVSPSPTMDESMLLAAQATINRLVYDLVDEHQGSISAEHGLGQLKREEIKRYKSSIELTLQQAIKQGLDPLNLMNPGKVL
ncbi:FAD-binding oxidoreductase [Parvibium lacunae]|uniref:FAD-binding oxidoreductase n=1 Tax=Parvibium lacunae TaxID=1888893 RepID=A0A368L747_9BURK|nr:FAD-binding oxidoreductase [Parvibium lacunae]RCS59331.1 FAD-binding oxidoreductase [Parvibium lacunae]